MPNRDISVRPGLTVVAALAGAVIGGLALGYGVGEVVFASSDAGAGGGLAALGAALVAGAVGAFVGAAVALAIAFREEPGRARAITIAVTVLLGPVLLVGLVLAAAQIDRGLVEPPVWWLLVAVPVAALVGRRLAAR